MAQHVPVGSHFTVATKMLGPSRRRVSFLGRYRSENSWNPQEQGLGDEVPAANDHFGIMKFNTVMYGKAIWFSLNMYLHGGYSISMLTSWGAKVVASSFVKQPYLPP